MNTSTTITMSMSTIMIMKAMNTIIITIIMKASMTRMKSSRISA